MKRILGILIMVFCMGLGCKSGEESDKSGKDASQDAAEDVGFGNPEPTPDSSDTDATVFIDGSKNGDGGCGESPFEANRRKVNVLLVIDKSGSMSETPKDFSTDKWSALNTALTTTLQAAQNDISFGLDLFPFPDGCVMPAGSEMSVPISSGEKAATSILNKLKNTDPSGGTPTAMALKRAFDYFTKGQGSQLQGDNYLILATDGGPNCNPELTCDAETCITNIDGLCPDVVPNCCEEKSVRDQCLDDVETRNQIQALKEAGIPTFVIGIPGSEAYANTLDSFAEEGGQVNPDAPPSYFAVNADGSKMGSLTAVLSSITTELITSCRLQLESVPPDKDRLNVTVEGEKIPYQEKDGWILDESTDPPTIEIRGKTCEQIEQKGVEKVRVVYGCPTYRVG